MSIRMLAGVLSALVFFFCAPCFASADGQEVLPEGYSRLIDVPGVGPMPYYAQNDPRWSKMLCEPRGGKEYRLLGYTGCGLAAMATVIASQLPPESLPALIDSALDPDEGFPFCADSVNGYRCAGGHELTFPTTTEDFSAYLPVIFASYSLGNNTQRESFRAASGATYISLLQALAEAYGLSYKSYREWSDALEALSQGRSIVTTVGKGIFTSNSHYLVLASVDDGWVYLLDPFLRTEYELDRRGVLQIVEPGLVRASLADLARLGLSGFYTVGPANAAP